MPKEKQLLVTGAGGQLGAQVVEILLARGVRLIAGSRRPEKLAHLAAKGAELRQVDFDDEAGLARAFASVDRVLLISTDTLDAPGARLKQHRAAIAAAEAAGVSHLVYTSGPEPGPGKPVLDDHYWTEHAIASSKLGWTVLRNHLYADLLLLSAQNAIASGQYVTAAGEARRAYLTREDAAYAAAGALASDFEGRRILQPTGPDALTGAEIAALLSELSGKPVAHIAVTPEQFLQGALAAGAPRPLAEALAAFDRDAGKGFHGVVTTDVADLSGHTPTSLRAFLTARKSQFASA